MPESQEPPAHILFVDDDNDFRTRHARLLCLKYGYVVDEAKNASQALARVDDANANYDVALIDQVLTGHTSGVQLMQKVCTVPVLGSWNSFTLALPQAGHICVLG